jgi:tetratricopeptide (TPR) repeat protein
MKQFFRNPWLLPFLLVVCLVAVLATRKLSDPDIGSHLKAGKWILENKAFPDKDTFTYTVRDHDYTDMNWLFQAAVYSLYIITGYGGLSIIVMLSLLCLLILLLIRIRKEKVPLFITGFVFILGFLVMETRITLRPEMVTFLFITLYLMVLEDFYYSRNDRLFLLPLIMLFWCNIHGLFVLGFGLTGTYFLSLIVRDRKIGWKFLSWFLLTVAVCFINPYFVKGVTFPLELFTRFDASNVFHEHIKELKSFYSLDKFLLKDVLFMVFLGLTFLTAILTWKKRKIHEFLLLVVFAYLALVSIRNIALFAVIGMPVLAVSCRDLFATLRDKAALLKKESTRVFLRSAGIALMIIMPVALTARIITGYYYYENNEYARAGIGIDNRQLPEKAADFLLQNSVSGRIVNGISLGGWLSWRLPQPVFIDGRLEVIREKLYEEVTESWNGGLKEMADKYQADFILYNYTKYYPWTAQLASSDDWRPVFIDGLYVVFARVTAPADIPEVNVDRIFSEYGIPLSRSDDETRSILEDRPGAPFLWYWKGFVSKTDDTKDDLLNMGSFFLQLRKYDIAERFLLENLKRTGGWNKFIFYALADIYSAGYDKEKAAICYRRILEFDPGNTMASSRLEEINTGKQGAPKPPPENPISPEARQKFNEANDRYNKGDYTGSVKLYEEAIRLAPAYFKAYNNLGIVKASVMKDYKGAIEVFSKAIEIYPDYSDAWLGRGASKIEMNDLQGACEDWKKAVALGSRQAAVLLRHYCQNEGKNKP